MVASGRRGVLRGLVTAGAWLALLMGSAAVSTVKAAVSAEPPAAAEIALPPWAPATVPSWVRSVQVLHGQQALRVLPDGHAARRGSVNRHAHLPIFGARPGPGCYSLWFSVGPQAWVCGDETAFSGNVSVGPHRTVRQSPLGLPYRYLFAGRDGALAYASLEEVDVSEPVASLEPGFAVAVVAERVLARQRYVLTKQAQWVPLRDLRTPRAVTFRGSELAPLADASVIPVAWVVANSAALFVRRGKSYQRVGTSLPRMSRVDWLEEERGWAGSYARIDDLHWLRTKDLRHPTVASPPVDEPIGARTRWIDIELASQTLVAYEGKRPIFATMVSTGKGRTKGHPFETPKGVHRVWVKLVTTTMDNLENDAASRYYRIEDVPYVQFFHKGVGLHAAFWHRSFGRRRSHGCVNLSPLDAERLFWWTGPHLPNGWSAALPTAYERGSIIRVR